MTPADRKRFEEAAARMRAYSQNEEMVDNEYTQAGRDMTLAASVLRWLAGVDVIAHACPEGRVSQQVAGPHHCNKGGVGPGPWREVIALPEKWSEE